MSIFASIVEGDYKNKAEESRQVLYASLLYMFMMESLILVPSTVYGEEQFSVPCVKVSSVFATNSFVQKL